MFLLGSKTSLTGIWCWLQSLTWALNLHIWTGRNDFRPLSQEFLVGNQWFILVAYHPKDPMKGEYNFGIYLGQKTTKIDQPTIGSDSELHESSLHYVHKVEFLVIPRFLPSIVWQGTPEPIWKLASSLGILRDKMGLWYSIYTYIYIHVYKEIICTLIRR